MYLCSIFTRANKCFYLYVNSIGVRKDWPELARILNKFLASLTQQEKFAIKHKWQSEYSKKQQKTELKLTANERDWLAKHPVIKVGNAKEWPPFNYYEHNKSKVGELGSLESLFN